MVRRRIGGAGFVTWIDGFFVVVWVGGDSRSLSEMEMQETGSICEPDIVESSMLW